MNYSYAVLLPLLLPQSMPSQSNCINYQQWPRMWWLWRDTDRRPLGMVKIKKKQNKIICFLFHDCYDPFETFSGPSHSRSSCLISLWTLQLLVETNIGTSFCFWNSPNTLHRLRFHSSRLLNPPPTPTPLLFLMLTRGMNEWTQQPTNEKQKTESTGKWICVTESQRLSSRVNPYCVYKGRYAQKQGKSCENTVWRTDREQ